MVLFLPRDAVSVPVSRQVLDGCLETLGVVAETRTDIALALSEACANVIQHAGPGDEYEVMASAGHGRCMIEVVNKTCDAPDGAAAAPAAVGAVPSVDGMPPLSDGMPPLSDGMPPLGDGMPPLGDEHGRGLKIMNAVVDNLRLSGGREGTVVHFEKALEWVPGAAGEHLSADG
jgi:serine/threonine-protein kinase RsbW